MAAKIDVMMNALQKIWKKIAANSAVVQKRKLPIHGNIGLFFSDDDIGVSEKQLLRSYLNVTKNISGCQALRARIGHILFGFLCVYGECIFFTVSPNRRHSSLIFKFSGARCKDVIPQGQSLSKMKMMPWLNRTPPGPPHLAMAIVIEICITRSDEACLRMMDGNSE